MAAAKKLYALANVSTPDGIVRPGGEIEQELSDEARATLLDEGLATESKSDADAAAAASVAAPEYGTTTGGVEVIEEVIG